MSQHKRAVEAMAEMEQHIAGGLTGIRRQYGQSATDKQMAQYLTGYLSMYYPHALVPAAATERLRPWLERIIAASPGNGEPATEYIGRLKGIALAALAEYARNEGSDAEPAAMSLLDRDTYNRLAGSAEPDGGGGA